ncbi:Uncharacterised protein [Mycobacteroides abscessus subsp. abscessus]|nr:Uncharacterised protein [Mycobacteroides abscessus subsp. abscessus]
MSARPTTAAATLESSTSPADSASRLHRISSRAKKTPANGALKVAEIPPAAPQASRSRNRRPSRRSTCPTAEPVAAPIWTIGPSRPTEPPPPMHNADAKAFTIVTRGAILPPLRATAYITSGTP